jgi:tRNA (cmo5U34)-methyltransferase
MSDNSTPYISKDYDLQVADTLPYYQSFHQETINLIKSMDLEPKTWLDTGCGTGTLVEKAVKIFPDTKFILCDPSGGMLNEAQKKLSATSPEKLLFLKPLATQKFPPGLCANPDVITAIQSHHYLSTEEREEAVQACNSLLKDNGIFITFENILPLTDEGVEIGKTYWMNYQLSKGRDSETIKAHLERFDQDYFPITVIDHLKLLRKTGFRMVELFWFSYMQAGFYCIK